MALAIVPCERNLIAPKKPQHALTISLWSELCPDCEPDDLYALAAELSVDEDLGPVEAISQALALQDDLMFVAALWDVDAALAGNPLSQLSSLMWP